MAIDLFEDASSGGDDDVDLSKIEIDEAYARRLEHNKKRADLHRYEELKKQGKISDSDSDSSSSSSSDYDEEDDPAASLVDVNRRLKTIARIRRGDEDLLRKDAKIYSDDSDSDAVGGSADGVESETKKRKKEAPLYLKDVMAQHLLEEGPEFGGSSIQYDRKAYDEQQRSGVRAFLEAADEALGGNNDDDDDMIREVAHTPENDEEGEAARRKAEESWRDAFGPEDDMDEDAKFLKDYLINQRYRSSGKVGKNRILDDGLDVSEDEEEIERQEEYEARFNFRHEEAGAVSNRVLGHARTVEGSVRKIDSSRKRQRKRKEERMAAAEQERREEVKHLKNLRRKELEERLDMVHVAAGVPAASSKLAMDDLKGDFDPEEYDRKMAEMYGDEYYEAEDVDPEYGDDDDMLELDTEVAKAKLDDKEKRVLEELYKLDYEDAIGDLKTRFKYKSVPANRFGLAPDELLSADDKSLNQYVSLKRLNPYRDGEWKVTYHKKRDKALILGFSREDRGGDERERKSTGKGDVLVRPESEQVVSEVLEEEGEKLTRSRRRKRRKAELKLSQSRLLAYGKIERKKKKSSKKKVATLMAAK